MNLLLVDDSALVRKNMRRLLRKVNSLDSISDAGNAVSAIDHIEQENPDIIILDLRMPGASGFEVLRHIKEHNLPTLVIVMTNHPTETNREKGMMLGAKYFFDKTNDYPKVIQLLHNIGTVVS